MEHVLVDLAPGRQKDMPVVAAAQPGGDRARRRSRSSRRAQSASWRPARNRQQAVRLRADMREFEWALARWTR